MEQSQWEIVILKPAPAFLSFLAIQLPDVDLPDLLSLQTNTTAYVMRKHATEDATLEELERHYPLMFRHEINRCLGEVAGNQIDGSFFDFLCSFKFELHSQIVLMEPSIADGHQLICVKPRSVLLRWMQYSIEDQEELGSILERVNLSHLTENATVIVKNFNQLCEVEPFVQLSFQPIFEAEMARMCDKVDQWPLVDSFQKFNRYFGVEIHSRLIHL